MTGIKDKEKRDSESRSQLEVKSLIMAREVQLEKEKRNRLDERVAKLERDLQDRDGLLAQSKDDYVKVRLL